VGHKNATEISAFAEEWDDDQNKVWGFGEISRVGDR